MWGYGKKDPWSPSAGAPIKNPLPSGGLERVHMWGYRKKYFPYGVSGCSVEQLLNQGRRCCFCWFLPLASGVNLLYEGHCLMLECWNGVLVYLLSPFWMLAFTSVVGVRVSIQYLVQGLVKQVEVEKGVGVPDRSVSLDWVRAWACRVFPGVWHC